MRCLNFRAAVKEQCRRNSNSRVQRTVPTYSSTEAGSRVTPYALEVAHGQCRPDEMSYWTLRVTLTSYIVLRRQYLACDRNVSRFSIPRVVNITKLRQLTCSCEFYERHGIPCRHMYEILGEVWGSECYSLISCLMDWFVLLYRSRTPILTCAGGLHTLLGTVVTVTTALLAQ